MSDRHANIPNWVSAIAAAVGCVAAIVFGVLQLTGEDGPTTTTTTAARDLPISAATLTVVGDDVVRVRVPREWDQRRSYIGPFTSEDTPTGRTPVHHYVATDDAEATAIGDFYDAEGVLIVAIADVGTIGLDAGSPADEVEAVLRRHFRFGFDCDPQYSRRQVRPPGLEGVLRDWRSCGPTERRFTDGMFVADDGSYLVYAQLRAGSYTWDDTIDVVVQSIEIDQQALHESLAVTGS